MTTTTGTAKNALASKRGAARTQPNTPPASANPCTPFPGCGWPPKMWHRALTVMSNSARPIPIRPLSWTLAGCRNNQIENSSMITGRAKATLPKSKPKVKELSARATSSVGMNHSTTAPATASRKMKNGTPSRRSSFSSVSLPSSRAAAPTMCASPIHSPTSMLGSWGGGVFADGNLFVGALPPADCRPRAGVVRAREVDRVLEAITSTVPPGTVTGRLVGARVRERARSQREASTRSAVAQRAAGTTPR